MCIHTRVKSKKLRRTSTVTGTGMPPGAQLCGPDAQLNGAHPVTCRCACCGTLLRALRWYSICDCTRTPNQVAQRRAYARAAMSGLPALLRPWLQLQAAAIIWEDYWDGRTHPLRQLLEGCTVASHTVGESRSALKVLDANQTSARRKGEERLCSSRIRCRVRLCPGRCQRTVRVLHGRIKACILSCPRAFRNAV